MYAKSAALAVDMNVAAFCTTSAFVVSPSIECKCVPVWVRLYMRGPAESRQGGPSVRLCPLPCRLMYNLLHHQPDPYSFHFPRTASFTTPPPPSTSKISQNIAIHSSRTHKAFISNPAPAPKRMWICRATTNKTAAYCVAVPRPGRGVCLSIH